MIGRGHALALALALASCSAGEDPTGQTLRTGVHVSPDADGLSVIGTGLRIDFGRAPAGAIAALDRVLGKGRALGVAGCPTEVVQQIAWGDLVLTFSREQFVGWRKGGAGAGQTCN